MQTEASKYLREKLHACRNEATQLEQAILLLEKDGKNGTTPVSTSHPIAPTIRRRNSQHTFETIVRVLQDFTGEWMNASALAYECQKIDHTLTNSVVLSCLCRVKKQNRGIEWNGVRGYRYSEPKLLV